MKVIGKALVLNSGGLVLGYIKAIFKVSSYVHYYVGAFFSKRRRGVSKNNEKQKKIHFFEIDKMYALLLRIIRTMFSKITIVSTKC